MTRRLAGAAVAGCILMFLGQSVAQVAKVSTPRKFELKAESPKFWELFAEDAQLEKVATGFGFTEGPVWDPHGFLYVSDEEQNKLSRVYPDGRVETVLEIGDPDGSTLDSQGHLITTASVLRAIIQVNPDGKYKVLAGTYEGKKFNSPNDVILGPDGALYFTDPTLDLPKGEKQEIPFQGVYRLGKDGAVRLLTSDLSQPNGLAFSPDGKRLYIDDTSKREIRVYDAGKDGELTNGRLFGKEEGRGGVPDGMRVDAKGNVYVTGPGGIWVWDPDGNHIGTIMMPESTANFNWGDAGYQTLYITARTSVYRLKTKARGFVPRVKGTAAK
ncbi:MAG: SMP-30/gluconolactonase/LRE family protein [Bryobacteraceae bacterium]